MIAVYNKRVDTPALSPLDYEGGVVSKSRAESSLRLTVVFTTEEGTRAALKLAAVLARNLSARITFLVTEVVPFSFPLGDPPVAIEFLERRPLALLSESRIHADEVSVKVCLCRDRKRCLRQILTPNSLVVIGGRRRWWFSPERELGEWLRRLGRRVIYVDAQAKRRSRSLLRSSYEWVLGKSADTEMANVSKGRSDLGEWYAAPH
jgi:hypothetical protein